MLNFELLLQHPKEFIQGFSRYYPVPEELLVKYEDVWDWKQLSRNTAIQWNADLLEKFKLNWNWGYRGLSNNKAMPWTPELLEQFKDHWSWYHLGWEPEVVNDREMLALCFSHWNEWHQKNLLSVYSFMPALNEKANSWAETFFEKLPNLNWAMFSGYDGFPWTADFIRRHADKFDWKEMSSNKGLPWSLEFIREHVHRWYWFGVSYSSAVPWNLEMIEAFQDHIRWSALYAHEERKLDATLLVRFKDKFQWVSTMADEAGFITRIEGLYNHHSILWTPELYSACTSAIEDQFARLMEAKKEILKESELIALKENEHWTVYQDGSNWSEAYMKMLMDMSAQFPEKKFISWKRFGSFFTNWETWKSETVASCLQKIRIRSLTRNKNFPWHKHPEIFQQLAKYEKKWQGWDSLSINPGLKLTEEMIDLYEDKWNWKYLSRNPSLTLVLIKKYEDRWDWQEIFRAKIFSAEIIAQYPDKWKLWWREMNDPPFNSNDNFVHLLRIPAEGNIKQHVSADALEEFMKAVTDKRAAIYRNDFEKALREENFDSLVPNITHDHYHPLLVEYANEIISCNWSASFAESLAQKALRFLLQKNYAAAIELFTICLRIGATKKISDLSLYCNALYVLQHDNTGLPVNEKLNHEFLKHCLPMGPKNPAIYYNAACLYMEMNDLDKVYECIQLAKKHKYENYDGMINEIKNTSVFSKFVSDNRFNNL